MRPRLKRPSDHAVLLVCTAALVILVLNSGWTMLLKLAAVLALVVTF
jgi:hypothetical protein